MCIRDRYIPIFILVAISLNAQQISFNKIEKELFTSLKTASTLSDSINIYNDLSYNYRRTDPQKVLEYANLAIEKAKSIKYKNGLAYAKPK